MNASIEQRNKINAAHQKVVAEAIAILKLHAETEYRWQRFTRGCSTSAAHRETADWIRAAADQIAEQALNHVTDLYLADK
jgi:hypothetical protein